MDLNVFLQFISKNISFPFLAFVWFLSSGCTVQFSWVCCSFWGFKAMPLPLFFGVPLINSDFTQKQIQS